MLYELDRPSHVIFSMLSEPGEVPEDQRRGPSFADARVPEAVPKSSFWEPISSEITLF